MNFYYDGNRYDEKEVNYNPDGTVRNVVYRRGSPVIFLVNGVIFCLVGLFLIVFGISSIIDYNSKSKTFTQITGKVVDIKSRENSDTDTDTGHTEYYTEYAPIIEYTVDGKSYRYESFYSRSQPTLNTEVEMKYNPNNPEDVILKNDANYGILPIVGVVFLLVGAFFGVLGYKSVKRRKNNNVIPDGNTNNLQQQSSTETSNIEDKQIPNKSVPIQETPRQDDNSTSFQDMYK